jgi:hypothetical protein
MRVFSEGKFGLFLVTSESPYIAINNLKEKRKKKSFSFVKIEIFISMHNCFFKAK